MEKLTVNIKVRIDQPLKIALQLEADARRLKVADVIRDALYERYLPKPKKGAKHANNR